MSMFAFQTRNLIYTDIIRKIDQLQNAFTEIQEDDGPLFKSHAAQFLQKAMESNELGRRI